MTRIEDQLFAIVHQELNVEPGRIGPDTWLTELGDSLDWMNLLSALEDAFDIRISNAQSESLHTVGDLLRLLKEPSVA